MSVFNWILKRVPDSSDEDVRRRVVYAMLGLNLVIFLLLIAAVSFVIHDHRFQTNLCKTQEAGRELANHRTAVIRDYLNAHGAHRIAVELLPNPEIDCSSGLTRQ